MAGLSEDTWNHRFAGRLSELLIDRGIARYTALADAYAHAENLYPRRSEASPEQEANLLFMSLSR